MPFRCKEHPQRTYSTPAELRGHFTTSHSEPATSSVDDILRKHALIIEILPDDTPPQVPSETRGPGVGKPIETQVALLLELQLEEARRRNTEYTKSHEQQQVRLDQHQAEIEGKAKRAESFDDMSKRVGNAIIEKNIMGSINPPPPPVDVAPPESPFMELIGEEGKDAIKKSITDRILGKDQKEPMFKVDHEFIQDITSSVDKAIDKWGESNDHKAKMEYERYRVEEKRREIENRGARLQQAFNFMVVFEQKFGKLSPESAMSLMDRFMGESNAPPPASAQPQPQASPGAPPAPEQAPAQPSSQDKPQPPQQSGEMPPWEEAGKGIITKKDETTDSEEMAKIFKEVKEVDENGERANPGHKKNKSKRH